MTRGFRQFAVEMIALDKAEGNDKEIIYGAITTGEEWRFARLHRKAKIIEQDINLYFLPTNLEIIL